MVQCTSERGGVVRTFVTLLSLAVTFIVLATAGGAFAAGGDVVWTAERAPIANELAEWVDAAVSTANGAVSVTGTGINSSSRHEDIWTSRYSLAGDLLWKRSWDDGARLADYGVAVGVDRSGNTYVCGRVGAGFNVKTVLLKYGRTGQLVWQRTFRISRRLASSPCGLHVDLLGRVYVAGTWTGASGRLSAFVTRWSPSGTRAWTKTFSSGTTDVRAGAFAGEALGTTYLATSRGYGVGATCLTIKYTSGGTTAWVKSSSSPGEGLEPHSIAVRMGGVAVTGNGANDLDQERGFVSFYSTGGAVRLSGEPWTTPSGTRYFYQDVAIDGAGRVHACGGYIPVGGGIRAMDVCYDEDGTYLWSAQYATVSEWSSARTITAGSGTTTYVAGTHGAGVFAKGSDVNGLPSWWTDLSESPDLSKIPSDLAMWKDAAVFLAGSVGREAGGNSARLVRITP